MVFHAGYCNPNMQDVARLSKSLWYLFYKITTAKVGKFLYGILWSCTGIDQSERLLCTCYFIKSVLTNVLTGDLQQFVNKTDMPGWYSYHLNCHN